jgi:hypothetical protein
MLLLSHLVMSIHNPPPSTMQMNLPTHVQALCSVLKDEEYPFAIAGSSVLAMHLQNWSPNNVDIFLPRAHHTLKEYLRRGDPFHIPRYQHGWELYEPFPTIDHLAGPKGFTSDYLHHILHLVYKRYKTILHMTSLYELDSYVHPRHGPVGRIVEDRPPLLAFSWIGVHMVVNLEHLFSLPLEDKAGPIIRKSGPNIRLIISEKFPEHPSIKWGQSIIDSFDISICKLYLDETDLLHIDSKASEDLAMKQFSITIKPGIKWSTLRGRVLKYLKRGFSLDKIIYDDRLSAEFKAYIMEEFRYLARNVLVSQIFLEVPMPGPLLEILDENLEKFLRPSPVQRRFIYKHAKTAHEQIENHRILDHKIDLYESIAMAQDRNFFRYYDRNTGQLQSDFAIDEASGMDDEALHRLVRNSVRQGMAIMAREGSEEWYMRDRVLYIRS